MVRVLSFLFAVLLVTGCSPQSGTDGLSSAAQPPVAETAPATEAVTEPNTEAAAEPAAEAPAEPAAPPAELVTPGEVTIYAAGIGESEIYEPHTLPMAAENPTLLDIVALIEEYHGIAIPILSITQQKGLVVIDLDGSILEENAKAQVYWMLTTLGATLRENHRSFEWVQYRLEGEVGVFGERYDIPPLRLVEGNPEDFAAIRAMIPYKPMETYFSEMHPPIIETDETGRKLAEYLSKVNLAGLSVSSADEIDNGHILRTAVDATMYCCSDSLYGENYYPELKPFEAPAAELTGMPEEMFWLKEHVEETIRILYGDVSYTHQSFMGDKYRYLELLGVYTPPHMGGAGLPVPAIFGYEETEDQIVAEVAYVNTGIGGYYAQSAHPDGEWVEIPADELEEFVRTKAIRYTVTVNKQPDGRFIIDSQKLKEETAYETGNIL